MNQFPGFPGFPAPAAISSAPAATAGAPPAAPPPQAPPAANFPAFGSFTPPAVPPPQAPPAAANFPAFGGIPTGVPQPTPQPPARSLYAGAQLPNTRYPIPEAPYTYDLKIIRHAKIGQRGGAQTFVWEFETVQSNNPTEQPGAKHGYPVSLSYDSGYGVVLAIVLAALGFEAEAQLAAALAGLAQPQTVDSFCQSLEVQDNILAGRVVRAQAYTRVRGEKSKEPGKVDTMLGFSRVPS